MTAPKSPDEKVISLAERLLREISLIDTNEVAKISVYWAKFHVQKTIVCLRDAAAERVTGEQDFIVFKENPDGTTPYIKVTNPEEKWKILHNVKEREDERKLSVRRAFRGYDNRPESSQV